MSRCPRNETKQNFSIWVYGERGQLVRGSGLFVGESGISANHHFLTPHDGHSYTFVEGQYQMEVFAKLLGDRSAKRLLVHTLHVGAADANELRDGEAGLYFDWGPDAGRYIPHIDRRQPKQNALPHDE